MKKAFLLLIILLSAFVSSKCQNLIYTITATKEDQKTTLDSILFENITNKTRICFCNLPIQTSYQVNLTEKSVVETSAEEFLSVCESFYTHSNTPGILTVGSFLDHPESVTITVLMPNGQLIYKSAKCFIFPGDLTSVHIGKAGIFLVVFLTGSHIRTFKAAGKENGGAVEITTSTADLSTIPVKRGSITLNGDFSFSNGDSLRVSVYKDTYYSRPIALRIAGSQPLNFILSLSTVDLTGVSDSFVELDEQTSRVESYDDSTGVVEISFTGDKPDLNPGNIIVIDLDTMGYLRKIKEVIHGDDVITLVTGQATMNEVFVDKSFKLHTGLMNPGVQLKSTASPEEISAALTDEKGYIHPVEVIYHDKDGKTLKKSVMSLKGASDYAFPIIDFYRDLNIDLYGTKFDNVHLYIGKGHVSLTTDAVFDFEFTYEGELDENTKVKMGDLEMFRFYLDAEAEFLAKLVLAMGESFQMEDKKKLIDLKDITAKFFISTVPVWINFDVDIYGQYQFSADATLSADWGFESKHELNVGGVYYQETDSFEPISKYTPTNTIFPLTLSGEVNAFARAELYPRIDVKFYNFYGPYAEIVPYIQGAYNAGVQSQITPSGILNFLAWNSGISLGLDFRVGTELSFLGFFTKEFGPTEIPCFDLPLWQSPNDVSLISYLPAETEPGSSVFLKFKVTDLFGLPAPLCPVYVGGDGSFSNYMLFTDGNGEASVTWIPGSDTGEKTASATIFKFDKTVLKNVTYSTLVKESTSGETGKFTDSRDGIVYDWVQIGFQVWMAGNLAWLPEVNPPDAGSSAAPHYYVYGYEGTDISAAKATPNFSTYGVLYNWQSALTACPEGWHLPGDDEWKQLEMYLGMTQPEADNSGWRGTDQGTQMKATVGWNINGNGTNSSGFSGLPGGLRHRNGPFNYLGDSGLWWSSSKDSVTGRIWMRELSCEGEPVYRFDYVESYGLSVRCIKNN